MGIPKRPSVSSFKMKKYVGNNLNLNLMGKSERKLLVVGNNCSVELKDNKSAITVVGDNCRIEVLSGSGGVTYIGNNGAINLDKNIDDDVVTYVGKNGVISTRNGPVRRHCSDEDVRKSNINSVNIVNMNGNSEESISTLRTKVPIMKFINRATISLPNIQVRTNGGSRHKS